MRREALENLWRWGIRLWTWLGIEVRISLLLVIWMVGDGFYFLREFSDEAWSRAFLYWGVTSAFVFFIILLHEYGHCFAGRAVGGSAERIILWPLGGLALVDAPHRPSSQLAVALGGPLVNVAIMILMAPYIIWGEGQFSSHFLHIGLDPSLPSIHWYASVFFAINLDLFIFNLIPAFPMDGGRVLHALLWPRIGFVRATEIAVAVAKFSAVILVVLGVVSLFAGVPGLLLVLIGIFVWTGATQQQGLVQGGMYGGDQWADPYSFEAPAEERGLRGWWRQRKEAKLQQKQELEARQDFDRKQRVDELLDKVNKQGMTSLTEAERRFLKEASRHFR